MNEDTRLEQLQKSFYAYTHIVSSADIMRIYTFT